MVTREYIGVRARAGIRESCHKNRKQKGGRTVGSFEESKYVLSWCEMK